MFNLHWAPTIMLPQNEIQQGKDRKWGGGCNFGLDGQHQASLLLYLNKEMMS